MPVGSMAASAVVISWAVGGTILMGLAVITADTIAAWVGAATIVSAGVATVVRNLRNIRREQLVQDCEDRIKTWQDNYRQSEDLRAMERERHAEAEKTFDAIREDLLSEITGLRAVIRDRSPRDPRS